MRLIIFHVFGLLLLLSLNSEVVSTQKKCAIVTNGCSVPFDLPMFYKKTFFLACKKHDVCYSCGDHFGWKKSHCDKTFKEDMEKLCESRKRWLVNWLKVKICKQWANRYYAAVFVAGKFYWSKPSEKWCFVDDCKRHGDPSKRL